MVNIVRSVREKWQGTENLIPHERKETKQHYLCAMIRLVIVNFKPGEYIKKIIFQSVTQTARKKDNFRVLLTAVEPMTFWLPTSPDALSLSYRRLVDAKAIKLG